MPGKSLAIWLIFSGVISEPSSPFFSYLMNSATSALLDCRTYLLSSIKRLRKVHLSASCTYSSPRNPTKVLTKQSFYTLNKWSNTICFRRTLWMNWSRSCDNTSYFSLHLLTFIIGRTLVSKKRLNPSTNWCSTSYLQKTRPGSTFNLNLSKMTSISYSTSSFSWNTVSHSSFCFSKGQLQLNWVFTLSNYSNNWDFFISLSCLENNQCTFDSKCLRSTFLQSPRVSLSLNLALGS